MEERIKLLRHTLGLTQQRFADKLGIKGNTISQYESGRNAPIDAVISLICREFNVNEDWLRTGKGEMFNQEEETVVERLCAELHASELEAGIIRAYFRIDPKIREPFMRKMIQEIQAEYTAPVDNMENVAATPASKASGQAGPPPDLAAKVAMLERQNQEKDKQLQELAAEVAAIKEDGAGLEAATELSAWPSASAGSPSPPQKAKK